MNWKVRLAVCHFAIPMLRIVIRHLEDDVKKTKTELDDLGLELLRYALEMAEQIICEGKVDKFRKGEGGDLQTSNENGP